MPKLQAEINGFNLFEKLNTFEDFLVILKTHPYYGEKTGRDIYFALTYYILGEYKQSLLFLDRIISLRGGEDNNLFSHEIENAQLMKDCIEDGNYDKGVCQILNWQEQTIKEIGIKI